MAQVMILSTLHFTHNRRLREDDPRPFPCHEVIFRPSNQECNAEDLPAVYQGHPRLLAPLANCDHDEEARSTVWMETMLSRGRPPVFHHLRNISPRNVAEGGGSANEIPPYHRLRKHRIAATRVNKSPLGAPSQIILWTFLRTVWIVTCERHLFWKFIEIECPVAEPI